MSNDSIKNRSEISRCTTEIIGAYVSNNHIPISILPDLIAAVNAALVSLASEQTTPVEPVVDKATVVQIEKSITPDSLISFIDGMPYQMLKRHLTAHGLNPQSYRERYGLPSDYPMTAPSYSALRADISKQIRLGKHDRR